MSVLIITNGDSAASLLEEAKLADTVLPWRDVLHEGPLPQDKQGPDFWAVRADYLASQFGGARDEILKDFEDRHAILENHEAFERIELWFEHDLYDQLQLIECLTVLADLNAINKTYLVQSPTFLSMKTAETIGDLLSLRVPVAPAALVSAQKAWLAVRSSNPQAIETMRADEITDLMFLRPALKRLLQEYPGPEGLSRTERQILYSIDRGISRTGMLFARALNMEEAAFMGDLSFYTILSSMQHCAFPLVQGLSEPFSSAVMDDGERRKAFITSNLELTQTGKDALNGKLDIIGLNGIDRWIGGHHLKGLPCWRWDDENERLVAPPLSH
ncbi:DUF1835 domain-containing protein [Coralliovum pocilloporae]|uniref:DUF1835 domain-containing protein n=1 Tax=Coralliovum pocilloporae TaxID=3066369 RepID=UPI0033076DE0